MFKKGVKLTFVNFTPFFRKNAGKRFGFLRFVFYEIT